MKTYTVSEFAKAIGVTNVTVNNWIKNGTVHAKTSETGQYYFTASQVQLVMANMHLQRKNQKGASALYVIKTDDDKVAEAAVQNILDVQAKCNDESIYISSFETFFASALDKIQFDPNSEEVMKALRGRVLREFSIKLNKYVKEHILLLYDISELYQDFTWNELKAIILNDESKLTPELIAKFDAVKDKIEEMPEEKYITQKGEIKERERHAISYEFLKMHIRGKVSEISRSVGFTNSKILDANYANLLDLRNIIDTELAAILIDTDYPINMNAPEVKKFIKELTASTEKEAMKSRLAKAKTVGFYTVFRLRESDTEAEDTLYEYLDSKMFQHIFLLCAKADDLPTDIKRKIDIGVRNEYFTFTVQGERSGQS